MTTEKLDAVYRCSKR